MHSRLGSSPCISNIAETSWYKTKFPSTTLIQTFTKLLMKSWIKTAGEGYYSSESVFTGYTVLKSSLIRDIWQPQKRWQLQGTLRVKSIGCEGNQPRKRWEYILFHFQLVFLLECDPLVVTSASSIKILLSQNFFNQNIVKCFPSQHYYIFIQQITRVI